MYRPGLLTSRRHVNQCSISNSCVVFFSFVFKNNFPIQKCQLFKVGFHIATCVQVDHGPQNYKCSLVSFLFEKSVRLFPNPAKGEGRKSNAPGRTLGIGFWSTEEKEYRAWPVQLNNYFIFVSASAAEGRGNTRLGDRGSQEDQLHQGLAPKRLWKMVRLCNDS